MAEPRSRRRKAVDFPYPGLRPFLRRENLIFFGREGQTDALIERLRVNHFLAVLGSSGSGKSSLVRAGLLPALESGLMAGARSHWKMAVIRPGEKPIAYLANALAELVSKPDDPDYQVIPARMMLETMLLSSSFGLKEAALGPILLPNENLLVVVDQFEEIFRFNEGSQDVERLNEAKAFIRLLLEASADPAIPVYVVITMRSDFLGECPRFRDLPEAINAGQYLVPRLSRAQMREAIVGPAAVFNEEIAPDLVIRLLNDVGDNPDQLPILQHALMRTWDHHQPGQELWIGDYEAIGGLQNALNQHAEEIYANLEAQGLGAVVEALFKSLTETESEGKGIRRPTRLGQVCTTAGVSQEKVVQVVEAFRAPGCSFLMPPVDVPLTDESILDISHESFMRLWARLGDWVREEFRSAEEYQRLSKAAIEHLAGKVNLWRQPELGIALKWRETSNPGAAWASRYDNNFGVAMKFLDDSLAAWKKEEADKAAVVLLERQSEERKHTVRRQRRAILLMSILLIITILSSFWSLKKTWEADKNLKDAETNLRTVKTFGEALEKKQTSLNLALEIITAKNNSLSSKADSIQALDSIRNILLRDAQETSQTLREQNFTIEEKKRQLERFNRSLKAKGDSLNQSLAAQKVATDRAIGLRDSANTRSAQFEALQWAARSFEAPNRETAARLALNAFKQYTENRGSPHDPQIYAALHASLERYKPLIRKQLNTQVYAFDYDPEDDKANAINISGKLYQFFEFGGAAQFEAKATSNTLDNRFIGHGVDHRTVFASSIARDLLVYKGLGVYLARQLSGHPASISAAIEVPKTEEIWSGDIAGNLLIWPRVEDSATYWVFSKKFEGGINTLVINAAGTKIAVASRNFITLIDPEDAKVSKQIRLQGNPTAMAFSNNGQTLAFGLESGRIGYYHLKSGMVDTLRVHSARVSGICFSPDNQLIASCSYDQTIRLWRINQLDRAPIVLRGHSSWVVGLGFRQDSKFLYSVSRDKTMRYWYTDSHDLAADLDDFLDRIEFDDREMKQYFQEKGIKRK
jgi:hypothetical protein